MPPDSAFTYGLINSSSMLARHLTMAQLARDRERAHVAEERAT
jgi:hypothetical protein